MKDVYRLGDLQIGEKFIINDKKYLIINFNLSSMSLTTIFPKMVCALDLSTYEISCFNPEYDVKLERTAITI